MPLVKHIFPKPSKIFHTLVYLTSSSMDAPEQNLLIRKIKMEETKATETSKTRQMQYSKRISWTEYRPITREYLDISNPGRSASMDSGLLILSTASIPCCCLLPVILKHLLFYISSRSYLIIYKTTELYGINLNCQTKRFYITVFLYLHGLSYILQHIAFILASRCSCSSDPR